MVPKRLENDRLVYEVRLEPHSSRVNGAQACPWYLVVSAGATLENDMIPATCSWPALNSSIVFMLSARE